MFKDLTKFDAALLLTENMFVHYCMCSLCVIIFSAVKLGLL